MNEIELLKAAREKVAKGWTQGAFATDVNGYLCADKDEAANWCVLGALNTSSADNHLLDMCADRLAMLADATMLTTWNDAPLRTQEEVVALFDKAIEEASREA